PIRYRFTPVWERNDVRALVKQEKAQAKLDAKLKKKGMQVNGPVLPPQMPATAPGLPGQPGAVDAPLAAAPGIPGQPANGYSATDAERWRYTG
ncbi:hypothetical protein, partial [Streptomyces sp. Ag82_G6-1]